jgi:CO/xanthine dehydrogenase FAD-binding subunit
MSSVVEYHRPASLDEALALLARPGSVLLAGGTAVNAGPRPSSELLVDLQGLGLGAIDSADEATLVVGAMVRLSELAADERAPEWLRELARKEQPSSLRTLATVGGTLFSGGWESALLAGLLACDAAAETVGADGTGELALSDLLDQPARVAGRIVTAVRLRIGGPAAVHVTARTIADRPIVACVARRADDGVRLALSGVAATPVLVDDVATLSPPGDFRGTSEYRQHLASVLSARALAEIGAN